MLSATLLTKRTLCSPQATMGGRCWNEQQLRSAAKATSFGSHSYFTVSNSIQALLGCASSRSSPLLIIELRRQTTAFSYRPLVQGSKQPTTPNRTRYTANYWQVFREAWQTGSIW